MNTAGHATPYCYILNDDFKVKLAVRSSSDPLNSLYTMETPIDELPSKIESVVRSLTAAWSSVGPGAEATAHIDQLIIKVTPLHGPLGRHIGVFVEAAQ